MYPVVILETTVKMTERNPGKKLIIIVGLLINRVSVKLIDLLRTENCHRLTFVVNHKLSFLRIGWLRVALRERLRACRVRYDSIHTIVWCGWNNYGI